MTHFHDEDEDEGENELSAARSTVPEEGKAVVKPLEWQEISQSRSNEDPTTEVVGWEAGATGFACSYVVELTGGGASLTDPDYDEKSFSDPDAAKAAAQADYEQRILSALASVPAPSGAEPIEDALHSCICLLETLAESAQGRDDHAEWAMMSAMAENCRATLTPAEAESTSLRRWLGELLAVIHRDGGHYQDFAGTEQAVADAQSAVVLLFQAQDERNDLRRKLEEARKALEHVRAVISEGAMVGFNPLDGTWAERLYASQGMTYAVLNPARAAPLPEDTHYGR